MGLMYLSMLPDCHLYNFQAWSINLFDKAKNCGQHVRILKINNVIVQDE